ncbi:hypothetical protein QP178_05310 [Sphingomonas aurantiaca]|uniref:hypothetical protein n=1 Tax=Sphingomonas aurantiaca TaxID=185949 RepID=UPI002FE1E595
MMATNGKPDHATPEAFITDVPPFVVAHPMGSNIAPLGLDRPIALLGGNERLSPGGMSSVLGIDHVEGLRSFVAEACRRQMTAGRDWYHHTPLALLGVHGVGKGAVAHWIARNAGVPLFRITAEEFRLPGSDGDHRMARALPCAPVLAMAASCCANPVIVLEIDVDAPPTNEVVEAIAVMIDPRRNARWIDHDYQTIFDLSHISWILEVQGRAPVSRVYDHAAAPVIPPELPGALASVVEAIGSIVKVDAPYEREELRRLDIAIGVCAGSGPAVDAATIAHVHASLGELARSRTQHVPCADLIRHAQRSLAHLGSQRLR